MHVSSTWQEGPHIKKNVVIFSMESEPKVQNTRFTHHALGKKVVRKMEDQLLEYMQKELGRLLQGLCSSLTHFHSQTDVESDLEDDTPSEAAKGEKTRLKLDKNGFPVLPMLKDLSLSGRKSVIREIIQDAYCKCHLHSCDQYLLSLSTIRKIHWK